MRFIITATPSSEAPKTGAAAPPSEELIAAHMRFNEEMHKAGVLVASEGLNPAGKSARIVIKGGKRVVLDGPFAETKELVGGFYLVQVASREEAIKWALRCPVGMGLDDELTIHQMTEAEDIPPEMVKLIRDVAPEWSAAWIERR